MKFIFPQNYKFSTKIFGILDYSTAIVDVLWISIVLILSNIFFKSLKIKLFILIILTLPILIISAVGINGENMIYVAKYIVEYFFRPKVILYDKNKDCKR